jgi:hypothetical protein
MGVQLGGKVIWAVRGGCGRGAGTSGQQRGAVAMPAGIKERREGMYHLRGVQVSDTFSN